MRFQKMLDRFFEYMKERYPEKNLQRRDPNADHDKKLSVREYKGNQEMKREIERERQKLLKKAERLNDIREQMEPVLEEQERFFQYNKAVEKYCRENALSRFQYEKECYWVEAGIKGNYPPPEYLNPDRELEQEQPRRESRTQDRER